MGFDPKVINLVSSYSVDFGNAGVTGLSVQILAWGETHTSDRGGTHGRGDKGSMGGGIRV